MLMPLSDWEIASQQGPPLINIDGNKRRALAACLVFLETSHLLPNENLPPEWEKFVLDIAASQLDHGQTTSRLRKLLKPRARSVLRGMINHLLPIEVEVVL